MKKIISLLIVLFVCLCLTACGSGDTTNDKVPSGSDTTENTNNESKNETKSNNISVEEKVLFESSDVKVTLTGIDTAGWMGPEIKLLVENNGSKTVGVQTDYVVVNGYTVYAWFSSEVAAGKKSNDSLTLTSSDLSNCGIDTIKDVTIYFYIYDTESWDRIEDNIVASFTTIGSENYIQNYDDGGFELFNQNGIKAVIKKMNSSDSFWGADLYIYVENNSGIDICVQSEETSVNGYMIDGWYSCEVLDGTRRISTMTFMESDLEENGISDITELESKFYAYDYENWDRLFTTDFITVNFE